MKLKSNHILGIALIIIGLCGLIGGIGCNQQIIDLKYRFDKAVIAIPGSGTNKTVRVKKWNDYDNDMVQVIAEDGTVYYGHSNNILLIKEP